VALDPALSMLNELRRKAAEGRVEAVVGEGARLPFAGERFDAVILARVVYLMSDWQAVLRQSYDVLKTGGACFMSGATVTPTKNGCKYAKRLERCSRTPV
jgi:ubiquinone/menaquinone biosynthesis C-methylase UbiE